MTVYECKKCGAQSKLQLRYKLHKKHCKPINNIGQWPEGEDEFPCSYCFVLNKDEKELKEHTAVCLAVRKDPWLRTCQHCFQLQDDIIARKKHEPACASARA